MTGVLPAAARGRMTRSSASSPLSARTVWASIRGTSISAPSKSQACPGVKANPVGLPKASTVALIFVLNPPLLRPMAWASPSFFERLRCAGEHAQSCCRSWRTRCRHLWPRVYKSSPKRRFQPIGSSGDASSSNRQNVPANPATAPPRDSATAPHQQRADCRLLCLQRAPLARVETL